MENKSRFLIIHFLAFESLLNISVTILFLEECSRDGLRKLKITSMSAFKRFFTYIKGVLYSSKFL